MGGMNEDTSPDNEEGIEPDSAFTESPNPAQASSSARAFAQGPAFASGAALSS
jgi:hypothetical protein